MAIMLVAKRRNLLGEWEDCPIQEALFKPKSVYRCPECNYMVRPHGSYLGEPRFKHEKRRTECSFTRPSPKNRASTTRPGRPGPIR